GDQTVVPIALVPMDKSLMDLVATGLMNRPELAQSRALVQASLARLRQAQCNPLIPRLDVGYTSGEFGGGINDTMDHFGSRGDGFAQFTWIARNFGAGDLTEAQARRSELNQA